MSTRLHIFNLASAMLPNRGGFAVRRALLRSAGIRVGSHTRIATGVQVYDRFIEIGDEAWIGMGTRLFSCEEGRLSIGSRVDIAPMCLIGTGTHRMGDAARRAGAGKGEAVVIGDGTWLGMGAIVLPGARIGSSCVVAAGAVVPRGEYPPNSLISGVPGKVTRTLS